VNSYAVFDFAGVVVDVELWVGHAGLAVQAVVAVVEMALLQERGVRRLEGISHIYHTSVIYRIITNRFVII